MKPTHDDLDADRELLQRLVGIVDVEIGLPYGWEMGPFGPIQVLSAAPAIRLLQEEAARKKKRRP